MAIKGGGITQEIVLGLSDLLNEVYPLPYFFDIVHYDAIRNSNLIKHINDHGIQVDKLGVRHPICPSETGYRKV